MKLRAKDTVHISSVQSDNLVEGDEFELSDDDAAESLIKRGIAERVKVAAPKQEPEPKEPTVPENKGKAPVKNKGTTPARKKA